MIVRIILVALAFLSSVFFPYPVTILLSFVASLFVPPVGLLIGILTDFLYFVPLPASSPGVSLPIGILVGALVSVLGLLVRRFVKARIIAG